VTVRRPAAVSTYGAGILYEYLSYSARANSNKCTVHVAPMIKARFLPILATLGRLLTYGVLRSTQPPTLHGREMSSSLRATG